MPLPERKNKFPTAFLPDQQLAYVTDSLRDAEAVASTVDSPVFLRHRPESLSSSPLSRRKPAPQAQASQPSEALQPSKASQPPRPSQPSSRLKRSDASDASNVSAVRDGSAGSAGRARSNASKPRL